MLHTKYQSSMPSSFREEDFQRFCYFFPFMIYELWLEFNLLNNFGRASPKEHPCQVSSRMAQWFRRRRCLKKLWTTHDGRRTTDIGRSQKLTMSTLCSGELTNKYGRTMDEQGKGLAILGLGMNWFGDELHQVTKGWCIIAPTER